MKVQPRVTGFSWWIYDMSTPQPPRRPSVSSLVQHDENISNAGACKRGPGGLLGSPALNLCSEPMLRTSLSQVLSTRLPVVAGPSFLLLLYRKTFSICFLGLFSLPILCGDSFLACSEFLWQWPGFMFSSVHDVVLFDFFQCSRARDTKGNFPALGWEQPVAHTSSWLGEA